MDSFIDVYKETLSQIPVQLNKKNMMGCLFISNDLTRLASSFRSKEHVFISEFLEYLFTNLNDTVNKYDLNEDTMDEITNAIVKLIEELIPFAVNVGTNPDTENEKIKIYNHMKDVRYLMTNIQIMIRLTKTPGKKPRLMFE